MTTAASRRPRPKSPKPAWPHNAPAAPCLLDSAKIGHYEGALAALELGSDPDLADSEGATALHWSALLSEPKLTQLLLDRGASPLLADKFGRTPLMFACYAGSIECARLLAPASDASARTVEGLLALDLCGARGSRGRECAQLLIADCDPLEPATDGIDSLQRARDLGRDEIADLIETCVLSRAEQAELRTVLSESSSPLTDTRQRL